MEKTRKQLSADKALMTEEEQARRFLGFLEFVAKGKDEKAKVPAEKLAEFMDFLVSFIYRTASAGIAVYAKGNVQTATCVDTDNHVYTFQVRSESSDRFYNTGFSQIRRSRRRGELELAELNFQCECAWSFWGPHVKGGRLRICKHMFAAMLWLVHHAKKEDLPKFRQLVNFLLLAVMWANPSESLLRKIRKARREEYVQAWSMILRSLQSKGGAAVGEGLKKGVQGRSEARGFSAEARRQVPAIGAILKAILGGTGRKEFSAWFDVVCPEILSLMGARPADRTIARYQSAKDVRDRALSMRKQLGLLNGIARDYSGTDSDAVVRRALEVWAEGIRRRELEAASIEKHGLVLPELSGYLLESIEREIAIVLELWTFYDETRRLLFDLAREAELHGLENARRKLPK